MIIKPKTRPARYRRVPRQIESHASAVLNFPSVALVTAYLNAFAHRAVKYALLRPPAADSENIIARHRVAKDQIDLDSFFTYLRPQPVEVPKTRGDIERLSGLAADYADDGGHWRAQDQYSDAANEAYAELRRNILRAVAHAQQEGGSHASRALLVRLEQIFGELGAEAVKSTWSAQNSSALRETSNRLRSLARPTGWWRVLQRFWPTLPCRSWLDASQRTTVEQAVDAINTAATLRHRGLVSAARQQILLQLVGSTSCVGLVRELEANSPSAENSLASIRSALPTPQPATPKAPFELLVVSSLHDHIDQHGTTVKCWFDEIAVTFGATPARLARKWWKAGLLINGRLVRPGDWHQFSPTELARAVMQDVRQLLGAQSFHAPANVDDPQTVYDALAAIRPTHPHLRTILPVRIADWVRRARPYIEVPRIVGAEPRGNWYLACAAEDRPLFSKLLAIYGCRPAPVAMDVPHGTKAVLTCFAYGIAGQALASFIKGVDARMMRESRGDTTLPGGNHAGELRSLQERPDDHEDAMRILGALLRCKALRKVDGSHNRLALATQEPSLKEHFFAKKLSARWQTPRYFQGQLSEKAFLSFLEARYTLPDQWSHLVLRLAVAQRAEAATDKLVELAVLERGPNRAYRIAGEPPASLHGVPDGLYACQYGQLRGLTEEEFLAQLRDDDGFYSVMVYRVLDAWRLGLLTQADVTPFIQWYRAAYLL